MIYEIDDAEFLNEVQNFFFEFNSIRINEGNFEFSIISSIENSEEKNWFAIGDPPEEVRRHMDKHFEEYIARIRSKN